MYCMMANTINMTYRQHMIGRHSLIYIGFLVFWLAVFSKASQRCTYIQYLVYFPPSPSVDTLLVSKECNLPPCALHTLWWLGCMTQDERISWSLNPHPEYRHRPTNQYKMCLVYTMWVNWLYMTVGRTTYHAVCPTMLWLPILEIKTELLISSSLKWWLWNSWQFEFMIGIRYKKSNVKLNWCGE